MTDRSAHVTRSLADSLGVASLGLGLAELVAPSQVAALAGIDDRGKTRSVIRALGARECGHAVAILAGNPNMVWTRVAGDVVDLGLLGWALANRGTRGGRRRGAAVTTALAGITATDLLAGGLIGSPWWQCEGDNRRHTRPARRGDCVATRR
jgi:hypothetical protein